MKLLVASLLLVMTDAPRPNTLTPEEQAAGWVLLFDGDNAEGLRVRGQVRAEDDHLVLGGAVGSRVGPKEPLPGPFELRLDYRAVGTQGPRLIVERQGVMSMGTFSHVLPQLAGASDAWHEMHVVGTVDRQTGLRSVSWKVRSASGQENTHHVGTFQDDMAVSVWLEVMPGNELHLRTIRLQADKPAASWLPWLLGAGAGAVLLFVVAVAIWRWRRWRAAAQEG